MTTKALSGWKKMTNYAFKLYVEQQKFPKIVIAFDLGQNNSAASISSSDLQHAYYLTSIKGGLLSREVLEKCTSLILKHRPVGIVVGKPSHVNFATHNKFEEEIDQWIIEMGKEHPKTSHTPFTLVDEAWTTVSAKKQLRAIEQEVRKWGHLTRQKDLVDGMAAINILRRYLEFYNQK